MNTHALVLGFLGGWDFWLGLPIGMFGIILINRLAGGDWGKQLLEPQKNLPKVAMFMALGVIPLLFFVKELYPFAAGTIHVHPGEEDQQWFRDFWLHMPFFIGRSVFYVVLWALLITLNVRNRHSQGLAGFSLLALILSSTFAMLDWVANLSGNFVSTMFGLHTTVKHGLTALTVLIIVATSRYGTNSPKVRLHDWGNLLLAFTMFHAYLAFSQFMIIWNGNLPREIVFYTDRTHGVWGLIIIVCLIFELFVPLAMLFFKTNKRNPKVLRGIACLSLSMNFLQAIWIIVPSLYESGHGTHPETKDILMAVGSMAATTVVLGLICLVLLGVTKPGEEKHEASADPHGHGHGNGHGDTNHGNHHSEVTA